MLNEKNKTRLLFVLFGILFGMFISAVGGGVAYKAVKSGKIPSGYKLKQKFKLPALVKKVADTVTKDETPEDKRQRIADNKTPLSDGFEVFAASSLDRVFKDGHTLVEPNFTKEAKVSLARHEYEPFQIVVNNGKNDLKAVRLEIGELLNGSGGKLNPEFVSWHVVGYVPTKEPYYPVKYVGLWPDPLMPKTHVDIAAGQTQPFWVTVYASKNTPPGVYSGTIKLLAEGQEPRSIPLSVEVFNFVLPMESSLKTAFDFYDHTTDNRYPIKNNESKEAYNARIADLNAQFTIEMLKHRMNPVLNVNPESQHELAKVDKYRWFGLNNFSIGKRGGTLNNNWPDSDEELEVLKSLYRRYGELLALNKFLPFTYIYTWDEGKIGNPQVYKVTKMIKEAYPKLKNMVCYHGFWEPEKDPEWGKYIDIWCFQIHKFNLTKMKALMQRGIEMWMYVSGPGGDGSPNLAMDFDSIDYRIIPWMCWKYEIKGFLYWCVNWWVKVDPFKSAANTKWSQNGNGLLFYPGEDGPVVSLRAAVYRDGMEDYEYLMLLKRMLMIAEQRGLKEANAEVFNEGARLITVDDSIVFSMKSFTKDEKVLKERRRAVAAAIQKLTAMLSQTN